MYVKYPLSLRNVEDLLHERGIDICHETVRFWRRRFTLQTFASVHGTVHNHLNQERHLVSRETYKRDAQPRWLKPVARRVEVFTGSGGGGLTLAK